jgi:cytochrome c biogenesis protein CcmG/thiol:disulfide interchange protein DsbE
MRKNIFNSAILFFLLSCNLEAQASMVDFINGVHLGKNLPELQFSYLGDTPDIKNRVLLIDFWATWCEPCRVYIPNLNKLQAKYAERGLLVIGISKEKAEQVQTFQQKVAMNYVIAVESADKTGLHQQLGIKALPYAILVDRTGKIVWRGQPEEINDNVVETVLNQGLP